MKPLYLKNNNNINVTLNHAGKCFGQAPLLFSGAMECDCHTFEQ